MKNIVFNMCLILCLIVLFGCDDSTDNVSDICDFSTEVNEDKYENTPMAIFQFIEVSINGDCLVIKYSSSGCDGLSWEPELFDSGNIAESFPIQRFLKMDLDNKESCLAVISKTSTFDLTPIQTSDKIIKLNLEGWNGELTYEY